MLEQAEAASEINLEVQVLPGDAEPYPRPFRPLWPGVPTVGTAIAQGLLHGDSFPRRGRERPEQWSRLLCSSQTKGQFGKPWHTRRAPNPCAGTGLPS